MLGWPVMGVWPDGSDGTDVNALHVSHSGTVVATGDDFGKVNLYRYPAIVKEAEHRAARGHSSHVTNVRFLASDAAVVSTGGGEMSVLQWRFDAVSELGEEIVLSEVSEDAPVAPRVHKRRVTSLSGVSVPGLRGSASSTSTATRSTRQDPSAAIKYAPCRTAVYAPSAAALNTGAEPTDNLHYGFCYGYRGRDHYGNLGVAASGEVVWFAAALGVVYDRATHTQRMYVGHTDDVESMAMHPERTLVATAQVGKVPAIHVWDADSLELACEPISGFHTRGVCAMSFSPDGSLLATIGMDNEHSIAIYNWRTGQLLTSAKCHQDKVFACEWSPDGQTIVTAGVKHIRFWTFAEGGLSKKSGAWAR